MFFEIAYLIKSFFNLLLVPRKFSKIFQHDFVEFFIVISFCLDDKKKFVKFLFIYQVFFCQKNFNGKTDFYRKNIKKLINFF